MKYNRKDVLTTLTGFLMAIADSVPGVSGGTIAYITGKYETFIGSIAALGSKSSKDEKKHAIEFLLKLGIGWVVGMVLAISLIASLVSVKPYELVSLFLGFIIISIPFIAREERILKHIELKNILCLLGGIITVVSITYFSSSVINLGTETSILKYIYIFIAGIIAISAMILPGISGSTFLLIFGLYIPIITAVKGVLHLDFSGLTICLVFGVGVLIGLFYFSKFLKHLLAQYRLQVVFVVIGLMIGSIYAIIMGPTALTDDNKQSLGLAPLNLENFKLVWGLIGVATILGLEKLKNILS